MFKRSINTRYGILFFNMTPIGFLKIEKKEMILEEQRKIRIIAVSEKFRKAPIYIAPQYDPTTVEFMVGDKKYKGKIDKNMEGNIAVYEHEGDMPFRLTDQDMYRIQHLTEFDLTNGQRSYVDSTHQNLTMSTLQSRRKKLIH